MAEGRQHGVGCSTRNTLDVRDCDCAWFDAAKQAVAEADRMRSTLREIERLARDANEEYEASCRRKVSRIHMLAKGGR